MVCFATSRQNKKFRTQILQTLNSEKADHAFKFPKSAEAAKFEEAIKEVGQTPHASPIDRAIADAYSLQKAGEAEKAIEKWRSIAYLMEGIDSRGAASAWFSAGYLLSGNPEEAISAYDQAIRLNPRNSPAYTNRGSAKNSLGQHKEAIKDYGEAIRLDPENSLAYSNRGSAKSDLGQHEEAINDCDEAIHLNPYNAIFYINRGIAKAGSGHIDEAQPDFQTALRLAREAGDDELVTKISNKIREINNSGIK